MARRPARTKKQLTPVVRRPGGPDHERLDAILRQTARNLFTEWLRFAEAAREFLDGGYWSRFQCQAPEAYFEARLGVKYRTVRRWLSVVDGLRRLPPGDRPDAERALEGLGSHKAGVLAPVLGREGEDWQAWVRVAQGTAEPEIQRRVSVALGHRPRGDSQDPGEAWYRALLAKLPDDDFRAETQRAFRLAERETGTDNPIGCFRWIIAEFIATYEPKATA